MLSDPIYFILWFACGLILLAFIYVLINDAIKDWKFAAKKLKESREEEENVRECKTW